MRKFAFVFIGAVLVVVFLNYGRANKPVLEAVAKADTEIAKTIAAPSIDAIDRIRINAEENYAKRVQEEKNAEKVKVYVPAKDTKTCMKMLKTEVINNQVIECNKDRTIEVRRDELENFKKEQGI